MGKININYSELVEKFDEVLISTSRGFDTEIEFLESWVPHSDINQSLRDLINSALEYNTNNLEISFNKNEEEKIDLVKLKEKFENKASIILEKKKLSISPAK